MDKYCCNDCGERYEVRAGQVIKCPVCESKERELLPDQREVIAAFMHESWIGWMEYLFDRKNCEMIPLLKDGEERAELGSWAVSRWKRQMKTAYADLPEEEKQSDRVLADKLLELLEDS